MVLGIVSIVLILIELDSNKDGLLQAMDWIMFTSSVIQVAGIILGWVAAGKFTLPVVLMTQSGETDS